MLTLFYRAIFVVSATLSLLTPDQALAQSWKPLCVNGGNTTGAHNSTWQKINTPGTGGSTWKKAGDCIVPTCANGAPNYPTCTFPNPIDLSGIPTRLWSSPDRMWNWGYSYGKSKTLIVFGQNGTWRTEEVRSDDGSISDTKTGAFLKNGANPFDFEIYIHMTGSQFSEGGYNQIGTQYDIGYRDRWINLGSGSSGVSAAQYIDDIELYSGPDGLGPSITTTYKRTYSITVRKISDTSIKTSMNLTMAIGPNAASF